VIAVVVLAGVIVGFAALRQRMSDVRSASAIPAAPVPVAAATAAPASAPTADSAQAAENARLQGEVADARRIALDAERKLEQLQASKATPAVGAAARTSERADGKAPAKGATAPQGHLFVMVRGGTPSVYIDGEKRSATTPTVIEVGPGRHVVAVRGMQPFYPAERTLDVSAGDTMQVLFASKRLAATLDTIDPRTLTPQQRQALQRAKKQFDGLPRGRRP
jgi:hypothetical protein